MKQMGNEFGNLAKFHSQHKIKDQHLGKTSFKHSWICLMRGLT